MTDLSDFLASVPGLFISELASIWFYVQLAVILLAAAAAAALAALVRRRVDPLSFSMGWPGPLRLLLRALLDNLAVLAFALATYLIRGVMLASTWPSRSYFLSVAAALATAWLIIDLLASLIRNRTTVRLVAVAAWTVAALSILGLLDDTIVALDRVGIMIGGLRLSPLLVIKVALFLLLTLWVANTLSNLIENRIRRAADLTPSMQVLIAKLVRLALITLAILVVLGSAGIDLSALAIFSGAIGVGLGFGLQKIVGNFVSGVILLADKSIKPGDVISVGDSFGVVGSLNTRYVTVAPRDGREVLIPNEQLVTQQVINWTYSHRRVRLDVPFGVAAGGDPHQVRALALQAAAAVPRVLADPPPSCHLVSFGNVQQFMLRFWIEDPADGTGNVRSDVMLALWDALGREGIRIT